MRFCIFDIEADGLLDTVTIIHCLSYQIFENNKFVEKGSITNAEDIKRFFTDKEFLVGHNIIRYDIPVLKKILGIDIDNKLVDTLAISWYLYPTKNKHGLEIWGNELGVEKPVIEDWTNQSVEDYIYRCEADVEINTRLFLQQFDYLIGIYNNLESALDFVSYLNFKMDCLKEQEEVGIPLNIELTKFHLNTLQKQFDEKTELLTSKMPINLGKVIKIRPKVMFKADGSLSVHGTNWIEFLKERDLPENTETVRELPNPGSDTQLKEWLFQLGWKPVTFKESKSTGKKIPQVSLPFGQGICNSVKELYAIEPALKELEGYFKIKHRIGVFKSFLKNTDSNGKVYATAHGLTNTLRLTHSKPIANLPKPGVFYGKEIREVLTTPGEEYIMCGSDVSGLEDSTKRHYIYPYDKEYVIQMEIPGFDAHLDIGVLAGLITKEEEEFYKWANVQEELSPDEIFKFASVKKKRHIAKTANFAMTYNAFPSKIAETAKITLEEATKLFDTYWQRNWAIKKIVENCFIKTVRGQKWLYNPVGGYYLYLYAEKDIFSTLNQGTGVRVFDSWLYQVRKKLKDLSIRVIMQYHDELALYCLKIHKEEVEQVLRESISVVNKNLKLNVEIGISVDFGNNYSEVH